MKNNTLNTLVYIGDAIKHIGLGIIVGLYLSESQFRSTPMVVVGLILAGECIRIWARGNDSPAYRDVIAHWTMIALLVLVILIIVVGLIMSAIKAV